MRTFGLIHHFEILLRNAIDGALGKSQPQLPITATWLLDFEALRLDGIRQVIGAIGRLERGKGVTRDRVVAGLPFSFWTDLFGRRYENLWRQRLHAAFPHGTLTRKEIGVRLKRIQRLRNRVAHHDSLLGQDVISCLEEMLAMAAWIDPAARGWLESRSDALETARRVN